MIRRATVEDAPAVAELVTAAYSPWIPVIGRRPRPMDDDYSQVLAECEGWMDVEDDALRGVVIVRPDGERLWVENVAVHPSAAGAGLGKSYLEFAELRARELGAGEMWLFTHELMHANRSIYSHLGWSEFEPPERIADVIVYFRKPVAAAGA